MRIALIGNCQVQSLALLAAEMLNASDIRTFDYSQPYSIDEKARQRFADNLTDCDLILAQTALLSFTNERELRSRFGSKLITIANFYFRGLFPDSCYIGDFTNRLTEPTAVHSVLVLDAFRRGLSETAALRHIRAEILAQLGLFGAWSGSMEEMRRREANGVVDVPAADLMEAACRRYPAFLTMNHPSLLLLAEYLQSVFAFVGLGTRSFNALALPDPLAEHDTTPILDEVAEHLKLPYRVSQLWKINSMGRRFVGREEFVAACYDSYRRTDPARLLVHSPTDLVTALASDPAHAYLVNASAEVHAIRAPLLSRASAAIVRTELERLLDPVTEAIADIRLHTHKVHSYLEVVDPKVEWIVQTLAQTNTQPIQVPPFQFHRRLFGRFARAMAAIRARLHTRTGPRGSEPASPDYK